MNNSLQLPVVDMLSSQRNNSNNPLNSLQHPPSILLEVPNYRMDCLSPIHELPTPIPSPSPTPIISRRSAFSRLKDADDSQVWRWHNDKVSIAFFKVRLVHKGSIERNPSNTFYYSLWYFLKTWNEK